MDQGSVIYQMLNRCECDIVMRYDKVAHGTKFDVIAQESIT